MKRQYIAVFAAVAVLTASVDTAQATILPPGHGTPVIPVLPIEPTGGTVLTSIAGTYNFSGNAGVVTSTVISGGSFNSLGGYTFRYTVSVASGDLVSIILNVFSGSIDVGYNDPSRPGDSIFYTANGAVIWTFWPPLTAGQTATLYVNTSMSIAATNVASLTDGGSGFVGIISSIRTASNATNVTFLVSGNTLKLSWPADHLGWILQSQTNALSMGLKTNWFDVAGSGSTTNAVITNDPANRTVFFRLRSP